MPVPETPTRCRLYNETDRPARYGAIGTMIAVDVLPDETTGLLVDLSENGLALQCLAPLPPGPKSLRWLFPSDSLPIEVSGEVVWSNPNNLVGIRFVDLSESAWRRIQRWIAGRDTEIASPDDRNGDPSFGLLQSDLGPEIEDRPCNDELAFLAERALAVTRANGAAIVLASADGGFVCRASVGAAPDLRTRIQTQSGLTGEAIRTGNLVCCDDTDTDPRVDPAVCRLLDLRSLVIVPITHAGATIGVLECLWNVPRAFNDSHIAAMCLIAEAVPPLVDSEAPPAPEAPRARATCPAFPGAEEFAWITTECGHDSIFGQDELAADDREKGVPASGAPVPQPDSGLLTINQMLAEDTARAQNWSTSHYVDRTMPRIERVGEFADSLLTRLPRSVPTQGDPKWIGALFLVGIAVALACVVVFVYLWVQEVNRGVGHVLLQSSLPPTLSRILWG